MYKKFKAEKDAGMAGLNKGLPFKLERFNRFVPGVMRERLYLLGGGSGAGKSKTANELFIFNVFDNWRESGKKYKLNIHYFSLEMPESKIISELAARWVHKNHGIILDSQYILSHWSVYKLSPFVNEMLESDEFKEYINDFQECTTILDTTVNYIKFNIYIDNLAKESGRIRTREIIKKDGGTINLFEAYDEYDEKQVTIVILDHISLVKPVAGQNKKQMLGDMADIMIRARNRYKFTFVVTQQLNRGFNSTDRIKLDDILPKDSDFRDGSDIFDAADVVLGLMSPSRERHTTFLGFKVASNAAGEGFKNKLLILNIIKNRHGEAFVIFPLLFLGETGELFELPDKAEKFDMDSLKKYKKYYI